MPSGPLDIRLEGDLILTQPCRFVDCTDDVLLKITVLKNMVSKYRYIGGIAAPQMGFTERMFAYRNQYGSVKGLISPVLVSHSHEMNQDFESCLSIPGKAFLVERYNQVTLEGIDADSKHTIEVHGTGFLARLFQHELDHLNGVLISQKKQ